MCVDPWHREQRWGGSCNGNRSSSACDRTGGQTIADCVVKDIAGHSQNVIPVKNRSLAKSISGHVKGDLPWVFSRIGITGSGAVEDSWRGFSLIG